MPLNPDTVRQIAHLARLELSEEEVIRYCSQLSAILDYAARLQAIDTSGIPPTSSVLPAGSVLREDDPCAGLNRDELLEIAPKTRRSQYQVPPVFE
jgi:aspartyl-tRNA(Asn)/glutamyl-tRNA(Gln) amidotransferase subunit C